MPTIIKNIFPAFIPLFVAINTIGVLPVFVTLTEGLEHKEKNKIIFQTIVTATCIAISFIFLGKAVLNFIGITIGDFMVAGGVLLFCIAITDITNPDKKHRIPNSDLGAVPLGTPLLIGPATLTISLLVIDQYGIYATLIAVFLNILLAGLLFYVSDMFIKRLGHTGAKTLSKVLSLLLAAFAIMILRKGITEIINNFT